MTENLRGAKKIGQVFKGCEKNSRPEKKMLQLGTQPNKCPAPKLK